MTDFEKKDNEINDFAALKEQQAPPTKGVYVHKFAKPFSYADKTVAEMEFRFEDLTGRDMLEIEREMQDMQEYVRGRGGQENLGMVRDVMQTLTAVRSQWGLVYPSEQSF